METMFETFSVQSIGFEAAVVLNLYSYGRSTGLSVSVGHGVTQIVGVFEGYIIDSSAAKNTVITGQTCSEYFQSLLTANG